MRYKKVVAEKIKSNIYAKIIQVNVPIRFYWHEDGFDGIEFGPIPTTTKYQLNLLHEVLVDIRRITTEKEPVPDAFLRAFKESKEKEDNDGST